MKKAGLITLLTLVLGAGSLVWAEKGIKITDKSGKITFVGNDAVDHVQFLEDHNGNEIGVKVVNGSQVNFFPASEIQSIEYVTDYEATPQAQAGTVTEVADGFEVEFFGTLTASTSAKITVKAVSGTGASTVGVSPTITVNGNKLSVVLKGYKPGTYTVTVPEKYVTIGKLDYNSKIEKEVIVDRYEVEGTIREYTNGFQVTFNSTLTRGSGEVSVSGQGSQGRTPQVAVVGSKITVSLDGYPAGSYTVTIPSGFVTMGTTDKNKEISKTMNVVEVKSATKKTLNREDGNEVKLACAFETNDVNPINAARYMLKDQQKALWDYVVLFSGNINHNNSAKKPFFNPDELNRPYFHANEGIAYILNHKADIIDPLKEMGIKVIMGVMPNNDAARLERLNEEGLEYFIEDLIQLHDKYGIDGFFWDEEHFGQGEGFGLSKDYDVNNFVRLIKRVKEEMPDAINLVFGYGGLVSLSTSLTGETSYEGIIDGILPNYTNNSLTSMTYPNNFPGTTNKQWGAASVEAAQGGANWANVNTVLNGNYGFQMVFAPGRSGFEATMDSECENLAKSYYGDTLDTTKCPGNGQNWTPKNWEATQ